MKSLRLLNQKPIAFYPIYTKLTGSITAGLLLSQLMYWFSKKDKFYKTDKEIMKETMLSERELKTAKSKIKQLPFITVTREGVPAKTYYSIDWEKFNETLNNFEAEEAFENIQTSSDETSKPVRTNRPNCIGRNVQTITKNTTKTTTNNINLKKEKNLKRKKDEFSFEKKMEYSQVSEEYKAKLKAKVLLEFGIEALNLFEKFELQLEAKGYKYKNFYKAFIAWNKDKLTKKDISNYTIEEQLGQDWLRIGIKNNKVYAVNVKTLELKVGDVKTVSSDEVNIHLKSSYLNENARKQDNLYDSIGDNEKSVLNANMSDLLKKAIKKF